MLTAIRNTELHWQCILLDEDGELQSCGQERHAPLEETQYLEQDINQVRGAVIALPRCSCGVQTFLKADYSLKEVWKAVLPIVNDAGQVWTFALKPWHARNLVAHWMHYERGYTDRAPVLPLPPQKAIEAAGIDQDLFHALWFGWLAYKEYGKDTPGAPVLQSLPQMHLLT